MAQSHPLIMQLVYSSFLLCYSALFCSIPFAALNQLPITNMHSAYIYTNTQTHSLSVILNNIPFKVNSTRRNCRPLNACRSSPRTPDFCVMQFNCFRRVARLYIHTQSICAAMPGLWVCTLVWIRMCVCVRVWWLGVWLSVWWGTIRAKATLGSLQLGVMNESFESIGILCNHI